MLLCHFKLEWWCARFSVGQTAISPSSDEFGCSVRPLSFLKCLIARKPYQHVCNWGAAVHVLVLAGKDG